MAGGGIYEKPSVKIRKKLKEFYDNDRPLFEIAGILLVLTGLLLNIQVSSDFVGQCIRFLQFFSLAGSMIILAILLYGVMGVLMEPIIGWMDKSQGTNPKNEMEKIVKSLSVILFPLAIIFFFLLTLAFYLFQSFNRELSFLIGILGSYAIVYYLAAILHPRRRIAVFLVPLFLISFLVVLPIFLFLVMFFPDLTQIILGKIVNLYH